MNGERRNVRVHLLLTENEARMIHERMADTGIVNQSAFLRKMAIDGYIIHMDMSDIREVSRLMAICSNNLNQYAKRANETGSIYAADIEDLRERFDGIRDKIRDLILQFANLS